MPSLTSTERRTDVPRDLRPCERRPSRPMLAVLRGARHLLTGYQGEPWCGGHARVLRALVRRGLAEEYRVTPGGQVFYRATPAGLDVAA